MSAKIASSSGGKCSDKQSVHSKTKTSSSSLSKSKLKSSSKSALNRSVSLNSNSSLLNSLNDEELNCAFAMLDINNDGTISQQELKDMLHSLNIEVDDELVNQMISDVTQNGNDLIDREQFRKLMTRFAKVKDKEEDIDRDLRAAFQVFDRDQNGYITIDELKLALEMLGENFSDKAVNTLMRQTDLNNDGKIDFNEFKIKFKMLL